MELAWKKKGLEEERSGGVSAKSWLNHPDQSWQTRIPSHFFCPRLFDRRLFDGTDFCIGQPPSIWHAGGHLYTSGITCAKHCGNKKKIAPGTHSSRPPSMMTDGYAIPPFPISVSAKRDSFNCSIGKGRHHSVAGVMKNASQILSIKKNVSMLWMVIHGPCFSRHFILANACGSDCSPRQYLRMRFLLDASTPVDTSACSSCRPAVEPLRPGPTHEQTYEVAIMEVPARQRMINNMADHTPDVASPPPPWFASGLPLDFAHLKTGQYKNSPYALRLCTFEDWSV